MFMLNPQQVSFLREQLATAREPLFFFDDDPDGLCSFLLLYRINREGHGVIIKSQPFLDKKYLNRVDEYHPDKIFVLDVPVVEQDFIDQAGKPIFWIDHHPLLERAKINYFNPRQTQPDIYLPTSRMAYQINQNSSDLWLAMVGCISDYHLPDFISQFNSQYPDLIEGAKEIELIIYQSRLGRLCRIFSFILKGKTSEVNKSVRILTRIKSPYEILNQETSAGKHLYQYFEKIEKKYLVLLAEAKTVKAKAELLVFVYTDQNWSFTSELSAELVSLHPDKLVIVARQKSREMKCSLRSKKLMIPLLLEKALVGIQGYGGGHEHACGANIKEEDWDLFLNNLKREIKK